MVKHTQKIRRQKPTNCLSVFDHFVNLARKRLSTPLIQFNHWYMILHDLLFLLSQTILICGASRVIIIPSILVKL